MPEKIKITFLGTSGPFPTKKRNHPAVLLTHKNENILVDCGEGTQRQFRKASLNPCKITRILITHWHGDHVLGIPGLLQTLSLNDYNKTLYIYGPRGIKEKIKTILKAFPNYSNVPLDVKEVSGKFLETNDFYLEAEKMKHGISCNAYCFVEKNKTRIDKKKLRKLKIPSGKHLQKLKQGKNMVYKGKKYLSKNLTFTEEGRKICLVMDTENNSKISTFAKNADLLIIESTYDANEEKLAREHKHMTVKQVIANAKKSRIKKLVLTHISDRYEGDLSKLLNYAKKTFKNTIIPKDLDWLEI